MESGSAAPERDPRATAATFEEGQAAILEAITVLLKGLDQPGIESAHEHLLARRAALLFGNPKPHT